MAPSAFDSKFDLILSLCRHNTVVGSETIATYISPATCRWFAENITYAHHLISLLMQIFFPQHFYQPQQYVGDGWARVVIHLRLSVSNLPRFGWDALLRWRILPAPVSRSTYYSHASHPILFDMSQVNTSCQSVFKSNSHIYRKVARLSSGSKGQQLKWTKTAVDRSCANLR